MRGTGTQTSLGKDLRERRSKGPLQLDSTLNLHIQSTTINTETKTTTNPNIGHSTKTLLDAFPSA